LVIYKINSNYISFVKNFKTLAVKLSDPAMLFMLFLPLVGNWFSAHTKNQRSYQRSSKVI